MMPLHRRHVGKEENSTDGKTTLSSIKYHPSENDRQKSSKASSSSYKATVLLILLILQAGLLMLSVSKTNIRSTSHLLSILLAAFLTSLPVFLSLSVGLGVLNSSHNDLMHQRYIPLTVAGTIVGNQLPLYISSGMAVVGIVLFGLASRPAPEKEKPSPQSSKKSQALSGPLKTVLAVMLMIAVLLTENFFVWVVSATYKHSQDHTFQNLPTPLQDNGQITMRYVVHKVLLLSKRDVVTLRNMIGVEWILVSGLGLSLVAIEMQGPAMRRNLWQMAMRGVLTLAAARFIRTVSFLITVLPSQSPKCYFGHFPYPPPTEWSNWILEGMKPQVNGGCNDLIISGHATVTSTLACVVVSIVGKPLFATALWMFVAFDYMVEVYEGFHYSVDMWLGAVMVNFIWRSLAPIEQTDKSEVVVARKFLTIQQATLSDVIKYSIPALGAYIQVVGIIPQDMGNYTIVVFIAAVILQLLKYGFQQYTQHILFCLLYIALGVYL
jgi:hypothetical protein